MLVALVLALAAPAPGLSLDWQAPAGCPDQALVRGRVAGMLGTGAFAAADLTAAGRVSAAGEGWRVELSVVRAGWGEERALVDSDCAAASELNNEHIILQAKRYLLPTPNQIKEISDLAWL